VISGAREGVKAATPQKIGGNTAKIDVIAPLLQHTTDHNGLPFSCLLI